MRVACGQLEVALAGGAEAPLSNGSLKAWEALRTLAAIDPEEPSASCRPFSKNRSGMVLGEGAAMLVIEPWERAVARGATIHGEILGYGLSNDASHITRPSVQGQAAAMRAALQSAAIEPQAVEAINAHGTGTQANDSTETAAIKAVFGEAAHRIPISAVLYREQGKDHGNARKNNLAALGDGTTGRPDRRAVLRIDGAAI